MTETIHNPYRLTLTNGLTLAGSVASAKAPLTIDALDKCARAYAVRKGYRAWLPPAGSVEPLPPVALRMCSE